MADAFLAGIIGFITGGIASILAPWVNWGIEKRRQKLEYRRTLIKQWRDMVIHVQTAYENGAEMCDNLTFYEMFERQPDFLSLEPNLSDGEKDMLRKRDLEFGVIRVIARGCNVDRINPIDPFVQALSYRIAKIEKDWDLV